MSLFKRSRAAAHRSAGALAREDKGTVLVEFLIVMPILLMLLFGAIQYGMLFITYNGMLSAVRETSRQWSVGTLTTEAQVTAATREYLRRAAPWVQTAAVSTPVISTVGATTTKQLSLTLSVPSFQATGMNIALVPAPRTLAVRAVMTGE
jgi:Flp pilus assembly protein TadG